METGACLCLLISLVLSLWIVEEASCLPSSDDKPGTIYDALKMNGLPIGLLPKNVKNYTIDEQGNFEVHLEKPCFAKFENQVCYDRNIKGYLSFGKIGGLSGIVAQDLFLWFPVKGIHVDVPPSGLIYFDVGVVYKQFSLSLFESPPDCKPKDDPRAEAEMMEGKTISDMLSKKNTGCPANSLVKGKNVLVKESIDLILFYRKQSGNGLYLPPKAKKISDSL